MLKHCGLLILFIILTPLLLPVMAVAQVDIPESATKTIEYIPKGEVKWILESSNDDEIVSVEKVNSKTSRFTIRPTDKLSLSQQRNYPIKFYKYVYDDDGNISNKYEINPNMFGLSKSNRDITKQNTLQITVPQNWTEADLAHVYMKMGPNSSTYSAATNTITVTGGTELAPITFEDIYDADVANGWDVVTKTGTCVATSGATTDSIYFFHAYLTIGDDVTETWLIDESITVGFDSGLQTGAGTIICRVEDNATLRLGGVNDAPTYSTENGCTVYMEAGISSWCRLLYDNSGSIELYSVNAYSPSDTVEIHAKIAWNCLFGDNIDCNTQSNASLNNIIMASANSLFLTSSGTINSICSTNVAYATRVYGSGDKNISNVTTTNCDYVFRGHTITTDSDLKLINVTSDNWAFLWTNSGSATVYRQYNYDMVITDDNGVPQPSFDVTIEDVNNNVIYTGITASSGTIPQQTLNYGIYTQANGDTATLQTPHTITITRTGYEDYTTQVTMDEQKCLEIAMTPISSTTLYTSLTEWWEDNMFAFIILLLPLCLTIAGFFLRHPPLLIVSSISWIVFAIWAYQERVTDTDMYFFLFWMGVIMFILTILDSIAIDRRADKVYYTPSGGDQFTEQSEDEKDEDSFTKLRKKIRGRGKVKIQKNRVNNQIQSEINRSKG